MENKLSKKSNNNDSGHDLRDVVLAYIGEKSVSPKIQSENEIKPAIAKLSMKTKTAVETNTVRMDSSKEKRDHKKMVSPKPSLKERQAVLAKIDAPSPQNDIKEGTKLKSEQQKQKKASPKKSKSSPREKKIKKISPKLSPLIDKKKGIAHKKISEKAIVASNPPLFPLVFKILWILNILVIIFLMVLLICVLLYYI